MATIIPLSWNDPQFSDNTNSGSVTLQRGGTLSNKSITQGGDALYVASVVLNGAATLDDIRINSREGVRIGGSGDVTISNSFIGVTGQQGDHADGIQAYSPGSSGTVTITNTTIAAHSAVGMFIADGYTGTFTLNNVIFDGGAFGLRIANDGPGQDYVSLTNVYFVGPFDFGAILFQEVNAPIHITHWENVRYATIENGVLVPGALIPPPGNVTVDDGAWVETPAILPTIASFSSDSNVVGDKITNDNTLRLTGTAPANSTVRVYDGANPIGSTTASSSGSWSYTTGVLADGLYNLTVRATSGATTSAASSPLPVTVDTVAPSAPSFSTTINTNKVTLNGTAEANSTVEVYDGTTQIGTTTTNGNGTWGYTTGTLSDATYTFTARATDAAGNTGVWSAERTVTVNAVPSIAVPTIDSFSRDSNIADDGITNDNTLRLAGTAPANSTVRVYDGANPIGSTTASSSGSWSYTTGVLADGLYNLTVRATSGATTSAASSPLPVTVDTVAPSAPSFSTTINTNKVTLNGTAEANSTVEVYDGTTQIGTTTTNGNGTWGYTTGTLSDATYTFTARATDAAGNTGAWSAERTVTVATSTPSTPTEFPDATNTGVPEGVTLTPYYGNLVINTPGAVIEGLDIRGNVTINADNVILKNCKVTSSAFSVVSIDEGATGVIVQDCEINGLGATNNSRGIGGQGTFLRNNIYNVENGINVQGSNTIIQDNYIHNLAASGFTRYDGIQILGNVSDITISDNSVINSHDGSAIRITNDFGSVNGVVIDNNKLSGGDFAVVSEEKSSNSGQITGVQVTNNYLHKGDNDYSYVTNNSVFWQGNIDLDTGLAVTQGGTLLQNSQFVTTASDIALGDNTTLGYASNSNDMGGTLTVSEGTDTASVALLSQSMASLVTSADGAGETLVQNSLSTTSTETLTQPHWGSHNHGS